MVGSCSDFLEIALGYYGLKSDKMTDELLKIAQENKETEIKDSELALKAEKERSSPLKAIWVFSLAKNLCFVIMMVFLQSLRLVVECRIN